jgi:hypothetical protein
MSGSNFFDRTMPFGGPPETEAVSRPVHVAVAYHPDGMIACYRDGHPYGRPYKSNGPYEFKAGQSVLTFGVRHLPPAGNRVLAGRIVKANLYDRALTDEEIATTSRSMGKIISETELLASMTEQERQLISGNKVVITNMQKEIDALTPAGKGNERDTPWSDLARAMFTFKEFLFVK